MIEAKRLGRYKLLSIVPYCMIEAKQLGYKLLYPTLFMLHQAVHYLRHPP